jgi:small subunit ribosomal protein S16
VAVRIRMKKMGRKHRPYFRIVAIDSRQPRDGRTLEDLGTYDPMVRNTDNRITLKPDRIKYWMSVGALPSEKVQVIIDKYLKKFEELAVQQAAAPAAPATEPAPAQS